MIEEHFHREYQRSSDWAVWSSQGQFSLPYKAKHLMARCDLIGSSVSKAAEGAKPKRKLLNANFLSIRSHLTTSPQQ